MRQRRKRNADLEIAPEEIFLDASNAPELDRTRFEGRLEKPLPSTTYVSLSIVIGLLVSVLVIRAGHLEIIRGPSFATQSAQNSLEHTTLFAPRGIITDRNGVVFAENVEMPDGGMARHYPIPSLGQIIGYVSRPKKDSSGNYYDTQQTGIAGLESQYNTVLNGENGRILVEKDVMGRVRSSGIVVAAKEGGTLRLSLDASLQMRLAEAISSTASAKGFIAGSGVIMDVHTGEILAIVSYPSYDPNVMSAGGPAEIIASYNTSKGHPFLDHAVQGVYAPGSIVKPFVSAGALTDGIVTASTVIDDPGSISVPDPYKPGKVYVYKGWKVLGPMTVESAIAWSSDIYFYTVGGGFGNRKGLGIERLAHWYRQFGFGAPTGIDLPGEVAGLIPTPEWKKKTLNEPWYLGDTYFTAIGQYAMLVTPIQAVRATAAVANGGTLLTPTLRANEVPKSTAVPVSAEVFTVVRSGMRQTVTQGLAQSLNLPYVGVAAKTGTAQTGTHNQYDNSWVEGYFPHDAPRYAFAVVLERGPEGAGSQAVQVMRQFFDLVRADNSPYVDGLELSNTQRVSPLVN